MDARPPLDAFWLRFAIRSAVALYIPVGGGSPVETQVIWLPTITSSDAIGSGSFGPSSVMDAKPRVAFRLDEVGEVRIGSKVVTPALEDGTPVAWTVSRIDEIDSEVCIAAVTESP